MAKSLIEKVINHCGGNFTPNVGLKKVAYLIIVAKRRTVYKREIAEALRTSISTVTKYTNYFLEGKFVKTRKNHKGLLVELDKKGINFFRRLEGLSKHDQLLKIIECPKCKKNHYESNHHILPVEHFGHNPFKIGLCRKCHDEIGELVHNKPKMSPEEYMKITFDFIYNKSQY
jgi:hypothetical protein